MSSSVKIDINKAQILRKAERAWEAARPVVAETILADCNTYCRFDEGTLVDSGHIEDGGARIVYDTPYAKKVYYTGTPRTHRNPNAKLMWCEHAKKTHKREWTLRTQKLMGAKI